jgi:inorganic triphosphatase YgiF
MGTMNAVASVERERKFSVHGLFRLPDLAAADIGVSAVNDAPPVRLRATYFDTDDLRLARDGITLRRREGGPDEGWHLKLPVTGAGRGTREELHLPLAAAASDAGRVPAELADLVTAYVRNAELAPVATLVTERTARLLEDADGRTLAELVDDTVSVVGGEEPADGERVVARFRELELELRDATADEAEAIAAALVAAGAEEGEFVPKAVRALGPQASADSDVPAPEPVDVADPAHKAVRAHLATNTRALRLQDVRVRRDLYDSVHQMRVAARRLRSGLRSFAPLVERDWSRQVREELRWVAGALGTYRDREVLLARFEHDLDTIAAGWPDLDVSGARRLVERRLRAEMAESRTAALAEMRSERYRTVLDDLVDAASRPRTTRAGEKACADALPPLVEQAWRRLRKEGNRLHLDDPNETWHAARITAKRARYTAEACVPVFGTPAKNFARQLERVTELLGEHQDAAVAADTVRSLVGERYVGGTAGFVFGLLHEHERAAIRSARLEFMQVWPQVSDGKWRRWLKT